MPNPRVDSYLEQLNQLLNFQGLSWWLIDVREDPDSFYCNHTMAQAFSLDSNLEKHSVSETCPIAGDFIKNVELKSGRQAKLIFTEYRQLLNQEISEYNNQFPYYNHTLKENSYFKSRARVLDYEEDGSVSLIFGIIEDISEMEAQRLKIEQQKSKFKHLSEKDAVTTLFNRRYFMALYKESYFQAQREQYPIAILMIDADNFKDYNDYYGHLKGDECLMLIAKCIRSIFNRKTDVVARFGGDEFIVYIVGIDIIKLEETALKLKSKLLNEKKVQPKHKGLPQISLSIGAYFAVPRRDEDDIETYIKIADENLYKAKSKGKNCLEISQG